MEADAAAMAAVEAEKKKAKGGHGAQVALEITPAGGAPPAGPPPGFFARIKHGFVDNGALVIGILMSLARLGSEMGRAAGGERRSPLAAAVLPRARPSLEPSPKPSNR